MDCLNNMNGCELITLANMIAISLSQNLSSSEIARLGSFFTVLGDNLSTISLTCENNNDNKCK